MRKSRSIKKQKRLFFSAERFLLLPRCQRSSIWSGRSRMCAQSIFRSRFSKTNGRKIVHMCAKKSEIKQSGRLQHIYIRDGDQRRWIRGDGWRRGCGTGAGELSMRGRLSVPSYTNIPLLYISFYFIAGPWHGRDNFRSCMHASLPKGTSARAHHGPKIFQIVFMCAGAFSIHSHYHIRARRNLVFQTCLKIGSAGASERARWMCECVLGMC